MGDDAQPRAGEPAANRMGAPANTRRSQRIAWHIPVVATWTDAGAQVRDSGSTEDVSAHGALLRLHTNLTPGHLLKIIRPGGKVAVGARVIRNLGVNAEGLARLGVEVERPSLEFWAEVAR